MKIFLINPGHTMATLDVACGLRHGFEALGHQVEVYFLEGRADWFAMLLQAESRISKENLSDAAFAMAGEEIPARILRCEPDLVVAVHGGLLGQRAWEALAKLRAQVPIHLVMTECPYEDEYFSAYREWPTRIWANDRFTANAWGVGYLPAAYDPVQHHPPEAPIGGCPDVLFVGTGWKERCAFLAQVDWSGMYVQIVGPLNTWGAARGTALEAFLEGGSVPGSALWPYYAGSGAVINLHRQSRGLVDGAKAADGWSLNPRAFQVPACGGLLVSDWRPEFDEVFRGALPTFETPQELSKLLRFYLDNPEARQEAIERSMEAVRPHSYTARAATILEAL